MPTDRRKWFISILTHLLWLPYPWLFPRFYSSLHSSSCTDLSGINELGESDGKWVCMVDIRGEKPQSCKFWDCNLILDHFWKVLNLSWSISIWMQIIKTASLSEVVFMWNWTKSVLYYNRGSTLSKALHFDLITIRYSPPFWHPFPSNRSALDFHLWLQIRSNLPFSDLLWKLPGSPDILEGCELLSPAVFNSINAYELTLFTLNDFIIGFWSTEISMHNKSEGKILVRLCYIIVFANPTN